MGIVRVRVNFSWSMFSRPQSHYHLRRSNSSLESKALADFRHQLFEVDWLDWPYNKSEIDIIFKIMDDGCMAGLLQHRQGHHWRAKHSGPSARCRCESVDIPVLLNVVRQDMSHGPHNEKCTRRVAGIRFWSFWGQRESFRDVTSPTTTEDNTTDSARE